MPRTPALTAALRCVDTLATLAGHGTRWVRWLPLACALGACMPPGTALAQDTAAAINTGQRFGAILRLRGEVSATTADGSQVRALREGDRVFVGERVNASAASEAVLRTEDAGLLAVRPGSSFLAERFVAEGGASDSLSLRLFAGSIRMITGWVGRSNRAGYRVLTPSATIGIRGTDHEPFVMTADLAGRLAQPEGTYDKVNRGGTTLDANGNRLDIEPGRVGFMRVNRAATTRSLLTVLLPVLLERVPDFFVAGAFDAEMDQWSARSDEESQRLLDEFRRSGNSPNAAVAPPAAVAVAGSATAPASAGNQAPAPGAPVLSPRPAGRAPDSCGAATIARHWLAQFDRAVARRRVPDILPLFATNAQVQATVRTQDGSSTTVTVERDAFVQSTVDAIAGLSDYRQRRMGTDAWADSATACHRINVTSTVIEQGRQGGQPYRLEATEQYLLERQGGKWVAVRAAATQR